MALTQSHNKSSYIAQSAILTTLALIFSYVEFLIPFTPAIPGVKPGLANIVVLFALYYMSPKDALTINALRIIIAGLLFSGVFGAIYSLAGGLVSFTIMALLKKSNKFSIVGVSMAGGVGHNLGQLIVASLLVSNFKLFLYFPVLLFTGLGSGIAIGVIVYIVEKKIPKHLKYNQ